MLLFSYLLIDLKLDKLDNYTVVEWFVCDFYDSTVEHLFYMENSFIETI